MLKANKYRLVVFRSAVDIYEHALIGQKPTFYQSIKHRIKGLLEPAHVMDSNVKQSND